MAIMTATCGQCSSSFGVTEADQLFYQKISAFGEKVPLPKLCPSCRLQRRLGYRNERALFPGQCASCQKAILSLYQTRDQLTVYCQECWWKDDWDACDYGQAIDWSRSLLEQYYEVRRRVPRLALVNLNSENSDYTNMSADNKNCYLLFAAENNENCSYGKLVQGCRECYDCNFAYDSELCYECVGIRNCYQSIFLQDCQNSRECGFSVGLRGCSNVWLSSNLQNKEYYIANQPVPPAEYKQRVAELTKDYSALQKAHQQWQQLNQGRLVKYANNLKSEDCTGDYLTDCKRVFDSFDVTSGQDCRYITDAVTPKDSYDTSYFYYQSELIYDCLSLLQSYNVQYSTFIYYCQDVQYGDQMHNSSSIFLSSGVRGKKYLILNKQYSAEEYAALLPKLIAKMTTEQEYGQLPPLRYSLFAYNDTVAQEYFPLTVEEAHQAGWRWNAEAEAPYAGNDGLMATQLPQTITAVSDEITQQVLLCSESGRAFRITAAELVFYRQLGLPLPRLHPEIRHRRRMNLRNPRKLWRRQCQCQVNAHGHAGPCLEEFNTTYKVERPEIVYCASCFQKELY